ncbi:hypothetical protein HHX47_DHR10000421 [Lentinula edodes]|nr:hypothetical protein HHX47_DHR10000421 [Lentinula edodes]
MFEIIRIRSCIQISTFMIPVFGPFQYSSVIQTMSLELDLLTDPRHCIWKRVRLHSNQRRQENKAI